MLQSGPENPQSQLHKWLPSPSQLEYSVGLNAAEVCPKNRAAVLILMHSPWPEQEFVHISRMANSYSLRTRARVIYKAILFVSFHF